MSALEILEAHTGRHFDDDGMRVCDCGYYLGAEDTIYNRVSARHRAHVAELIDQHMRERERTAKAEVLEEIAAAYPVMLRDMVTRQSVAQWLRKRAAI